MWSDYFLDTVFLTDIFPEYGVALRKLKLIDSEPIEDIEPPLFLTVSKIPLANNPVSV